MQLARHHTTVSAVSDQWHLVEAVWASVPVRAIIFLYDSKHWHITAVTAANGDWSKH